MAPTSSRHLLVWSLPTIAILLSYLWFKKKRIEAKSDPNSNTLQSSSTLQIEIPQKESNNVTISSPNRSLSRSLSGIDSQPIDIVLPKKLRPLKTNQVIVSDEDLDIEIQKIKSMKNASVVEAFKTLQSSEIDPQKSSINETKTTPQVDKSEGSPSSTYSTSPETPKFQSPKVIKCTPQKIILSSSASPMAQKQAKHNEDKLVTVTKIMEKDINNAKSQLKSKLNSIKKNKPETKVRENDDTQRQQSVERDSANHSPVDVMLASPSLSSISDNHSEGSNDSGKGGSDVATPPSRTPAGDGSISGDASSYLVYEFVVPQNLVGRLIGRGGCIITDIKEKSGTRIMIKKHPSNPKMKICAIEGLQINIDAALQIIRDKFPLKRYPEVTLEQIQCTPLQLTPEQLHLKLIEGINNDTIVSCMVAPNHFFMQQPAHPTFMNLNVQTNYMNMCYNSTEPPLLPTPILESTICAAQSEGDWYRVMVLSTDTETNTSHIIFLDYGGYAYVENSKLRQIRGDFLILPFQAAECILANIRPVGDESKWSDEAYSIAAQLTKGALAYTQVADYTSGGIPLVLVYILVGPQEVIFLNEELVNRGLAEWVTQEETEGAVGGVTS